MHKALMRGEILRPCHNASEGQHGEVEVVPGLRGHRGWSYANRDSGAKSSRSEGLPIGFLPHQGSLPSRTCPIHWSCWRVEWARRLSWRETARAFQTSWECVYRSVEWFVQWGLAHRKLANVRSIGVDELHWGRSKRADNFLTVIYQIDGQCRRLLWVGKRRTQATMRRGLAALGNEEQRNAPTAILS